MDEWPLTPLPAPTIHGPWRVSRKTAEGPRSFLAAVRVTYILEYVISYSQKCKGSPCQSHTATISAPNIAPQGVKINLLGSCSRNTEIVTGDPCAGPWILVYIDNTLCKNTMYAECWPQCWWVCHAHETLNSLKARILSYLSVPHA